jgi:hypothetical protein
MAQGDTSIVQRLFNAHTFTEFEYAGSRIFVFRNQNNTDDQPKQWKFFYVPVSLPVQDGQSPWTWAEKKDVRMMLLLGNEHVDEAALKAIKRKFEADIVAHASSWDVSPLVIDSMTALIVKGTDSPVEGVLPYYAIHPNTKILVLRFHCTNEENAQAIARGLMDGNYFVQVAYHFGGQYEVAMNLVSITADKLSSVLSRTIADGDNTNAQFIHRNQASEFINKYTANVTTLIYKERNTDTSELMISLQNEFHTLFIEGKKSLS